MAKLNPSITHNTPQGYGDNQPLIFTDDVPLKVFLEHLKYECSDQPRLY